MNILVVDDEKEIADVVELYLQSGRSREPDRNILRYHQKEPDKEYR